MVTTGQLVEYIRRLQNDRDYWGRESDDEWKKYRAAQHQNLEDLQSIKENSQGRFVIAIGGREHKEPLFYGPMLEVKSWDTYTVYETIANVYGTDNKIMAEIKRSGKKNELSDLINKLRP